MKSLIIAEKPSVAHDIARALGRFAKKGDHFENDQYVVTSAVGHLVELEMPEDIDKKLYGFWRLEPLPIIPKKFGLKPVEGSKGRLTELKKLLARKDVAAVINACDAGREGELIFTYIYDFTKSKLPVQRAWMQTMTTEGIRDAFRRLRDGAQMVPLADAARCRSESDWLIGINGTRALTKRMFGSRAGNVASVGRVQTPTLAIAFGRELEIRNFRSRPYWRITATFEITRGTYEGVYQRPNFKRSDGDDQDRADRVWDQAAAEAVLAACQGQPPAAVTEERKSATQIAPRLYDLTTLQREANNRFGLPARRTLQLAQALYERHKMITYPRTDSRALPEDYPATVKQTLANLRGALAPFAQKVLAEDWVRPNRRIFNNAQVSDHFAIIPTAHEAKHLDEMEAKIFDMIARRFVAAFYPPAEFDVTTRLSTVAGHDFKTEGKVLTSPGWLAVYGKTSVDESPDARALPALDPADGQPPRARTLSATLHSETTKPPPRYTEATLLSAMEGAGRLVDDDELAEAMKERGLGTPATRAEIIEGLVYQKYLERQHRELVPTPKAESLLQFLAAVQAEGLTKPDMSGEWEYKLHQIEHGRFSRPEFMSEIIDATRGLVDRVKNFEEDESAARVTDIPSPTDHRPLRETLRGYKSQDGEFMVYKIISGRKLQEAEVRELVAHGVVGPLDGFVSAKTHRHFAASVRLVKDEETGKWATKLDFGEETDLSSLTPFWTDPRSGAELCEAGNNYLLREKQGTGWKQTFRVGRILCRKPLAQDQAVKLVAEGKTDLIQGFISKKGRPFDAYLKRQDGRVVWEFPPRAPKIGADGKPIARKARTPPDLSQATVIGKSQLLDGEILQTGDAYYVRKGGPDGRVVFNLKRQLCQKDIPVDEVRRLLDTGRTELIDGFISKRGAPFKAYLVLSASQAKAEFEFPPR